MDITACSRQIILSAEAKARACRELQLHVKQDEWQSLAAYINVEHLSPSRARTRDADANGDQEATDAEDASEST